MGGAVSNASAPTLYICAEISQTDKSELTLEMRRTNDNELAIMAYSSLDTLVRAAGANQPWVAFRTNDVPALVEQSGADRVLLDTIIPLNEMRVDSEQAAKYGY